MYGLSRRLLWLAFVLLLCAFPSFSWGRPPAEADSEFSVWFNTLHNPHYPNTPGTPQWCCDVSDGHILKDNEWRTVDNHYEAIQNGRWVTVDDWAVLTGAESKGNPTGGAVFFYATDGRQFCFIPGPTG